MKFITAYGPKTKVRTDMKGQQTRTHQSGKDECDINKIMAKYVRTGVLDHQKEHGENYGFCTSLDLHEALVTVRQADEMFNDLPSSIRTKFDNEPGQFLDFVQDPNNSAELIELGLAKPKPEQKAPVVEKAVKPPTTPAPPAGGESAGDAA